MPLQRMLAVATLAVLVPVPGHAGAIGAGPSVAAVAPDEAREWGGRLDALEAAGALAVARIQADGTFPGRSHVRYDQRHGGVRVFGTQLVRQVDDGGRTLTVFGHLVLGLTLDTRPAVTADQAVRAAERHVGRDGRSAGDPELLVLPLEDGARLVWGLWVRSGRGLDRCFVDARTGEMALAYADLRTAAAVGIGTGVWGDRKKVSANASGSTFLADDRLRPPSLVTYDMDFDLAAAEHFFNTGEISDAFVARDSDNTWSDGGVVDAHTYAGWTYDYYYSRHGRRGIDGRDLPVRSITHFIPPFFGFVNAFWDPFTSAMFYGDGDEIYDVLSGALDVVAHELSHGVTNYSWDGIYMNESGALNESFSDVLGTSVEFFFEPAGNGRKKADYFIGEDVSRPFNPAVFAFRSMENPSLFCNNVTGCDPDHYDRRYRGGEDNGGVHINAGIPNQAFYLLVEGGTNRTSGLAVAGLGAENRERAEAIFYRGFTAFLTPSASFFDARRATIQAARELYGAASREEQQVTAAWTAVGID